MLSNTSSTKAFRTNKLLVEYLFELFRPRNAEQLDQPTVMALEKCWD